MLKKKGKKGRKREEKGGRRGEEGRELRRKEGGRGKGGKDTRGRTEIRTYQDLVFLFLVI